MRNQVSTSMYCRLEYKTFFEPVPFNPCFCFARVAVLDLIVHE